jgi:vancomycin resistance protein YoaR
LFRLNWSRTLLITVSILVLLMGLMVAGDFALFRGRVHHGVEIWGMPAAAGAAASSLPDELRGEAGHALQEPIRLAAGTSTVSVTPASAGISLDAEATSRKALAVGRKGPWWVSIWGRLLLWLRPERVDPVFKIDEAAFRSSADEIALVFERLPVDAQLVLVEGEPTVHESEEGRALDREALRDELLAAAQAGAGDLVVPLRPLVPAVSTEQAKQAVMPARLVLSAPITLGFQEKTFLLSPEDLLKMAVLDQAGLAIGRPFTFETEAARSLLQPLLKSVETAPVDAVMKPASDGKSFTVVPSKDGVTVEWDQLLAAVGRAAMEPDHRYVPIPTAVAAPKLTTMDAQQLGERRVVASFETYYSPSNEARGHNIQQVAELLDGHIVRPGEVFSFNKAVGPTTRAAGFDEAPVIIDGILTPGVGGGICQVSTTLFNAVFFAGLPVVERRPHSFYIEHYPVGRDATVSQGEVDFKFRNDTDQLILIACTATDHSVKVSLAAAEWDRQVSYQLLPPHDFVAPASSAAQPRKLRDPELAPGEVSELEPGIDGRTVRIEREVRSGDGSILYSDAFDSVYAPKDYVVRVGPPA